MALKDRQLTLADFADKDLDADPLLYVPANWTGVITDVFNVPGITLAGKLWVASQFLQEIYCRRWALNCLIQATIDFGFAAEPFFLTNTTAYLMALSDVANNDYQSLHALSLVAEEELRTFGEEASWNEDDFNYARLVWSFKWLCDITDYHDNSWQSIRDTIIPYHPNDLGWEKCKTKILEIINIHP